MLNIVEIDNKNREEIERVKRYALNNPYRIMDGVLEKGIIPGNNPKHVIYIKDTFRVVYSITVSEGIPYHHISISKKDEGLPSILEAETILQLFEIATNIDELYNVYFENESSAISLIKEMEK